MEKVPALDIFTKKTRGNSLKRFQSTNSKQYTSNQYFYNTGSSLNHSHSSNRLKQTSNNFYKDAIRLINDSQQYNNLSSAYSNIDYSNKNIQLKKYSKINACQNKIYINNCQNKLQLKSNNFVVQNAQMQNSNSNQNIHFNYSQNNNIKFGTKLQTTIQPPIFHQQLSHTQPIIAQNHQFQHPQLSQYHQLPQQVIHHNFQPQQIKNTIQHPQQFIQYPVQHTIHPQQVQHHQINSVQPPKVFVNISNQPQQNNRQLLVQSNTNNKNQALPHQKQYISLTTQKTNELKQNKLKTMRENEQQLPTFNYTNNNKKQYSFCNKSFKQTGFSKQNSNKQYIFDKTYMLQIKQLQNRLPQFQKQFQIIDMEDSAKLQYLLQDLKLAKQENIKQGNKYLQNINNIINSYEMKKKQEQNQNLQKSTRKSIFNLLN